jgi:hypothetical protein
MAEATGAAGATGPTSTTETAIAARPTKRPCWPDDPDYLDGYYEIDLPPERLLRAKWDVDIIDPEGGEPHRIIEADDPFRSASASHYSATCGTASAATGGSILGSPPSARGSPSTSPTW